MARQVRIATITFLLVDGPVTQDACYDQAFRYLEAALADGPDLILLPERFEKTGSVEWDRVRATKDPQARYAAAQELAMTEDGPVAERFCQFAARHNVTVVSNNLTRDGDLLYNQATFYGRQGDIVGRYRKLQPTEIEYEVNWTAPGDDLAPIEVEWRALRGLHLQRPGVSEICQIYGLQGTDVAASHTGRRAHRDHSLGDAAYALTSCYLVTSTFLQDEPLGWRYREATPPSTGFTLADGHRESPPH